jgi:hypothetical protein
LPATPGAWVGRCSGLTGWTVIEERPDCKRSSTRLHTPFEVHRRPQAHREIPGPVCPEYRARGITATRLTPMMGDRWENPT